MGLVVILRVYHAGEHASSSVLQLFRSERVVLGSSGAPGDTFSAKRTMAGWVLSSSCVSTTLANTLAPPCFSSSDLNASYSAALGHLGTLLVRRGRWQDGSCRHPACLPRWRTR